MIQLMQFQYMQDVVQLEQCVQDGLIEEEEFIMNGEHINGVYKFLELFVLQHGNIYNIYIYRSAAWHFTACYILDKMKLLRVTDEIENKGLDPSICGGDAFFYEPLRE